jgi:hypothetical protein
VTEVVLTGGSTVFGLEVLLFAWMVKTCVDASPALPATRAKNKAAVDVASTAVLTAHALFTDPLEVPFQAVELADAVIKLKASGTG